MHLWSHICCSKEKIFVMNEQSKSAQPEEQHDDKSTTEKPHHVPNPFEPGSENQVSQEDVDNEQKYKEALSERD
jgi:hypothetical protein